MAAKTRSRREKILDRYIEIAKDLPEEIVDEKALSKEQFYNLRDLKAFAGIKENDVRGIISNLEQRRKGNIGISIESKTSEVDKKLEEEIAKHSVNDPVGATAAYISYSGVSSNKLEDAFDKAKISKEDIRRQELIKRLKELEALGNKSPVARLLARNKGVVVRISDWQFLSSEFPQSKLMELVYYQSPTGGPSYSFNKGFFGKIAGDIRSQITGKVTGKIKSKLFEKAFKTGAGKAAKEAGKKVVTKVATKVGTRLGLEALLSSTGVGAILAVGLEVASWLKRKYMENKETFHAAAIGLIAAPFIGLFGGVVVGAAAYAALSGGIAAIPGFFGAAISGIASLTLASLAAPVLGTLIGIPVVVALILFIINSGAYITPPNPKDLGVDIAQSVYIGVEKKATPEGPFKNSNIPLTISYSVRVWAKKGAITDMHFENVCNVVTEGSKPNCTAPVPDSEDIPLKISPTKDYVFEYDKVYDSPNYKDSFVIDTFTVSAAVEGEKREQSAYSATIKIGDPPEDCPSGWPIALPQKGNSSLPITQWPGGGYSHVGAEAIDIATDHKQGFSVSARHSGTVTLAQGQDVGSYGKHVEITSSCQGKSFLSRYAHLSVVSVNVGQVVGLGHSIGLSGDTGRSSGPHLHYEFRGPEGRKGPAPNNPPYMAPTYIPCDRCSSIN